jgi:phosphoribosylglycinamide formyltransferase-1
VTRARLRIAILISGRGSNMLQIAARCADGTIAAEIVLVAADRPDAGGIPAAHALGLPTATLIAARCVDRTDFETRLTTLLEAHGAELVILAGFMRILGAPFVARWHGRMLNIHPSLLPKFKGLHTHRRALEAGERQHGASVHFVTPDLDGGPLVIQGEVPVLAGDDEATLSARVQRCEHTIYPRAIGWIASGRLQHGDDGPWFDGKPLTHPLLERFDADSNRRA